MDTNNNELDDLLFLDEDEDSDVESIFRDNWKILIVDDEEVVHSTTKLVLSDFEFDSKGIEFISAYTSEEAKEMLKRFPDISLILLDVVMESDDAGLSLVRYIREELDNKFIRIILRTGQPGQAPEERIIIDYDINDYKTKTELTVQKLFTTIISSLRAYQDLTKIEKNRLGLKKIVNASNKLFELNSLRKFVSGLIIQLTSMYGFDDDALYLRTSSFAATDKNGDRVVLAATGEFSEFIDKKIESINMPDIIKYLDEARTLKQSIIKDDIFIGYYRSLGEIDNYVVFKGIRKIDEIDREMIDLFSTNISVAFDNVFLNERIINTQKEVIYKLGEVVESRSEETNDHVRKVADYAWALGRAYGLGEEATEMLKLAAPLHDIGKIGIPEDILKKPGKLNDSEMDIIKQHAYLGYIILKKSNLKLMETASILAYGHHENYDGSGYPQGLKGDQIHIYARILAIVDVFDTMTRNTVYRKSYTVDEVFDHLIENKGIKFDPILVDTFISIKDEIMDIFINDIAEDII